MPKYRVYYTVEFNGYLDVEADSPRQARLEVEQETEEQDLSYNASHDGVEIDDVQKPEGGSYPPEEWKED